MQDTHEFKIPRFETTLVAETVRRYPTINEKVRVLWLHGSISIGGGFGKLLEGIHPVQFKYVTEELQSAVDTFNRDVESILERAKTLKKKRARRVK